MDIYLHHISLMLGMFGEGNGNPLQCSCLENPRDGEAWWAAVYGVAQSQTRLKRLSNSNSRVVFWSYKALSRECFYTTLYDFNRNLFTKEHICICPVLNYIYSNETKFTVIVWNTLLTIRLHSFHFNVKYIKFHMKINNILYNKY